MDCVVDLVIQTTIVFNHLGLLKLNIQCGVLMLEWDGVFVFQLGLYSYGLCV